MIPLETIVFFEILLSGFIAVRTYKIFSKEKKTYSEFEWIGLSAICGLIIIGIFTSIPDLKEEMGELLNNPFATGLYMSIFGSIFGYSLSRITRFSAWKAFMKILGKDGEQDTILPKF